jgi:hypothetical protein
VYKKLSVCAAVIMAATLSACESANDLAMKIGKPPESAVQLRSFETRRFDTMDESSVLSAATQTLQDLGYTITESSADVGVISASKERDARESGQIAGQIALTIVAAALGVANNPTWDESQSIHVTLVATPIENSKATNVRVSFDRYITNNHEQLWRTELVEDQKIYQEFFDKLSSGTSLHAEKL